MEYTIKIFPDPEGDGDFIAEIEELKGCSAFGSTPEEALQEVKIAMRLWLETAKEHGKAIPKIKTQIVNEATLQPLTWPDEGDPVIQTVCCSYFQKPERI